MKQEVNSLKQEIRILRSELQYKDVSLRISNDLKNTTKELLEEMKAEQDRFGKKIVKQLEKLKEPPIDTVDTNMRRAESLDSVMPKSTSEDSDHNESKMSEVEEFSHASKLSEHEQSDRESNHGSLRSDKTVINKFDHLKMTEDTKSPPPPSKRKKKFKVPQQQSDDEQSDTTGILSHSDTNRSSIPFGQPTRIDSPSGTESELSSNQRSSRHTKEIVMSPLSQLSPELNENSEVFFTSSQYKDKKTASSQPADDRELVRKSKFMELLKKWEQKQLQQQQQ